jgi:hypothetical protein
VWCLASEIRICASLVEKLYLSGGCCRPVSNDIVRAYGADKAFVKRGLNESHTRILRRNGANIDRHPIPPPRRHGGPCTFSLASWNTRVFERFNDPESSRWDRKRGPQICIIACRPGGQLNLVDCRMFHSWEETPRCSTPLPHDVTEPVGKAMYMRDLIKRPSKLDPLAVRRVWDERPQKSAQLLHTGLQG